MVAPVAFRQHGKCANCFTTFYTTPLPVYLARTPCAQFLSLAVVAAGDREPEEHLLPAPCPGPAIHA